MLRFSLLRLELIGIVVKGAPKAQAKLSRGTSLELG